MNLLKRLIVTNAFAAALLLAGSAQAMTNWSRLQTLETHLENNHTQTPQALDQLISSIRSCLLIEAGKVLESGLATREEQEASVEQDLAFLISEKLEAVEHAGKKDLVKYIAAYYKKYVVVKEEA